MTHPVSVTLALETTGLTLAAATAELETAHAMDCGLHDPHPWETCTEFAPADERLDPVLAMLAELRTLADAR